MVSTRRMETKSHRRRIPSAKAAEAAAANKKKSVVKKNKKKTAKNTMTTKPPPPPAAKTAEASSDATSCVMPGGWTETVDGDGFSLYTYAALGFAQLHYPTAEDIADPAAAKLREEERLAAQERRWRKHQESINQIDQAGLKSTGEDDDSQPLLSTTDMDKVARTRDPRMFLDLVVRTTRGKLASGGSY